MNPKDSLVPLDIPIPLELQGKKMTDSCLRRNESLFKAVLRPILRAEADLRHRYSGGTYLEDRERETEAQCPAEYETTARSAMGRTGVKSGNKNQRMHEQKGH